MLLNSIFSLLHSHGVIQRNFIMIKESQTNFMGDPPVFTIIGETWGGPPTYYNWTKDGVLLTNSHQFSITIEAIPQSEGFRYHDSIYHSTLTVNGHLPGSYKYRVKNVVSEVIASSIIIQGTTSYSTTIIIM